MKVEPLPPIPSPPEHLWRQFRVKAMPFACFGIVLVVTVWLWGQNLANPYIVGQAEGPEASVITPVSGKVSMLPVKLYQEVSAGDLIAVVDTSESQVLSNTVALIYAKMEASRTTQGYDSGDRVRLAQFQMDWLTLKAELSGLRKELQFWQADYERLANLTKEKISSERSLQYAKSEAERLEAEIKDKTIAAETAEKALLGLAPGTSGGGSAVLRAELAVAEKELQLAEAQLQPVSLRAPISGRIIKLSVMQEGSVVRGVEIAAIANSKADRIVGFVGQPINLDPKVGMKVEVRCRTVHRQIGSSQVEYVGPRIELFDAPLRVRGMGTAQQRGLPFVTAIPANMTLRPGEMVDLRLLVD
jgi:multidrug resistance efflux pump